MEKVDEQIPSDSHTRNATSPIRFAERARRPCFEVADLFNQCEINLNETQPTHSQYNSCVKPIPVNSKAQTTKEAQQLDLKLEMKVIKVQITRKDKQQHQRAKQ